MDDLPRESHAPATIHTVLQLQGGGIPTTKQGVKIQSKNNLAGVLLAEGYDLRWVGTTLDDMFDKIPVKELTTLAGLPPGPQKVQKLLEVIKQCDIQVPKIKPQLTSSAASNARRKKQQAMPHPDDYIVAPGALLNEDGFRSNPDTGVWMSYHGLLHCNSSICIPMAQGRRQDCHG